LYALKKFYIIYVKNVFNLLCWKSLGFGMLTMISQIFWSPHCILIQKDINFEIWRYFHLRIWIDIFQFSISSLFNIRIKTNYLWRKLFWKIFASGATLGSKIRFQRLILFGSFWKDRSPAQWETSHGILHIALVAYLWKNS
jgi:hypothetical protein